MLGWYAIRDDNKATSGPFNVAARARDKAQRNSEKDHGTWYLVYRLMRSGQPDVDVKEKWTDGRLADVYGIPEREKNPRHYGDLLHNPRERRWFPSALAIGVSRDGQRWYAHRIETDIGWDFPTLMTLFPFPIERVRTFGDRLVRVTFMPGDYRFKLKTDRGWTKPLPLSTILSPKDINDAAGFDITGVVRTGAPL